MATFIHALLSYCRAGIRNRLQFTNSIVSFCAIWWNEGISYLENAFLGIETLCEISDSWSSWHTCSEDVFSVAYVGYCSIFSSSFCNFWLMLPKHNGVLVRFLPQRISANSLFPIYLYLWFLTIFMRKPWATMILAFSWPMELFLNLLSADGPWSLVYPPFFFTCHSSKLSTKKENNDRMRDLSWVNKMDSAPPTEKSELCHV